MMEQHIYQEHDVGDLSRVHKLMSGGSSRRMEVFQLKSILITPEMSLRHLRSHELPLSLEVYQSLPQILV